MRDGKCPKCKSSMVFVRTYGLDGTTLDGKRVEHDDYVCTECGYYESYITTKSALEKLQKSPDWKKAG